MSTDVQVIEGEIVDEEPGKALVAVTPTLTVDDLLARRRTVVEAMEKAMDKDVHYGVIPGVNKPTLFKPGAEMLCVLFQLGPFYPEDRQQVERDPLTGHMDVRALCVLRHIPTGLEVAEGVAYASSREKKYAYRSGALICPDCGAPEVRKSKQQGKDEFYCWKKQGGCGNTFAAGTEEYASFVEASKDAGARVPNPDLPDTYNTVLKMAAKRALVAAALNATGASDVFTQDVEDGVTQPAKAEPKAEAPKKPTPTQKKEFTRLLGRLAEIDKDRKWQEEIIDPWVLERTGKGIADLSREGYDTLIAKVQGLLQRAEELNDAPFSSPPGAEHVDAAAAEQGMGDLPLTGAAETNEAEDIPL